MSDHTKNDQTATEPEQTEQTMPPLDLRKSRFQVVMESGATYDDVRLMPGDMVAAERNFDIRVTDMEDGAKLEHILYMVWLATRRKGYPADFETFINEVVDLDITRTKAAALDPTQPVR